MKRKEFPQNTSLMAGGMFISASLLNWNSKKAGGKKDKLGIALVGLGSYSTNILAPALQNTSHCFLAGIVTGTPEKEKIWAEKYGIPESNIYNYENFDRIAENPDIDIVYVVLPNSMHAEYTIRAANAGKHVICEKPMALDVAECEDMIEACKKNNRQLSIGYRMQYEPHTQEIMRFAREEVYGKPHMVSAGAGFRMNNPQGTWKSKQAYGGGALMDMGVYCIQAARYSTQMEPLAVTAQSILYRPEAFDGVDECMNFELYFPENVTAYLTTSFYNNVNFLHVASERGWYSLMPFSSYSGLQGFSSKGPFSFDQPNQQAVQMDETAFRIKSGMPMRVPGEEGLRDMRIIEALRQAVIRKERIDIRSS